MAKLQIETTCSIWIDCWASLRITPSPYHLNVPHPPITLLDCSPASDLQSVFPPHLLLNPIMRAFAQNLLEKIFSENLSGKKECHCKL